MLELRPSSPGDPESHAILTEYFALRAEEFPGGTYTTTFPDPATFESPVGVFLLAGPEGAAVGCGGIRRLEDSDAGIRYEVKHLFLKPVTRGRGWGRAILEELERRAREWDAAELVLDTHHTLEAAGRLYTRNGFEQIEAYNENRNATRWYRKVL
ncbi:GNAT family N-acetyltransferase [Microbacterium sp. AK031]|uniref:GNAT family N-acetyltransferase n=1 Tax=Microbacterium sp. AK031 TaxID=2723076 RepID=UPI00216786BD|nr:GNAT family N-acetyltransferase [Microbacterium sp. AK031]MCS3842299.1 GNAT superfamily N-acetyltransferase [Microbacterium sp. AK031]